MSKWWVLGSNPQTWWVQVNEEWCPEVILKSQRWMLASNPQTRWVRVNDEKKRSYHYFLFFHFCLILASIKCIRKQKQLISRRTSNSWRWRRCFFFDSFVLEACIMPDIERWRKASLVLLSCKSPSSDRHLFRSWGLGSGWWSMILFLRHGRHVSWLLYHGIKCTKMVWILFQSPRDDGSLFGSRRLLLRHAKLVGSHASCR